MKLKPLLIIAMVLLCLISSVKAQLNEISGTVTSEDGAPLSGASITAKGSKNSVITDANGQFRLSVAAGSILIISYVGHETLEVATSGKSVINATLKSLTQDLENVVVTVLGFRERGDKVGSSVSRIGTREVINSGETGLLQGMAGKASGVTITRSTGDPGAGSNIKIRGANTITGAAGPLVIVDGVPISNSYLNGFGSDAAGTGVVQQSRLNDINPNDIESLQILKGAAAASLWGSRAANGVIVITTKKGKAGALKISYTSTYSVDEINSRHPLQTSYGQGSNGIYNPLPGASLSWGDKIANRSGVPDSVAGTPYFLGGITGKKYYRITKKNEKETYVEKNFDGIFGKGQYWQNALSLSGGNDKSRFFFSLENLSQQGIIKENSNYIRNSIRLNSDHNLGKYLRFSNKAAFININSNRIQNNSNTAGLYLGLLRTPPDFDNIDYIGTYVDANGVEVRNRHRSYRRYLGDNVQPTYNNPYWTIFRQESPSKVNRFLISSEVSSNPFQWLELILRGGLDANYDDRKYFFPVGSAGERSPGSYRQEKISEVEKNIDLIARATKELTPDLNGTFILGGNINDRQRDQLYGESSSFLDNVTLQNFILTPDAGTHIINYFLQRGSNRGYSTVSFDYKDQLFLNVGGALEASSTISKSFFYPSADVAWQFNKLPQFQNSAFLSFGKIRAAWGKVGVQPTAYNFVTTYESAR
ncbi:MAG: SusC/RagA family TonB-linked outer membrane protein, partial [Bacteroidota bacterium]|nr:SusC/RagA family TonB-linked outer membrane protein [Bacteroidota bacterium]